MGILFVAFLNYGCAAKPVVVYETVEVEVVKYEQIPVPEALLRACFVDLQGLETNEDMERALFEAVLELNRCTDDKEAIRELE